MMRSMYSGVSGLRTHQTKMDVIGNNIANVNTTAFKSQRVTFNEVFSQTLQSASSASDETGRGGLNPMQVGLGVNISSIDMLMTQGAAQRTDNPFDLMIDGNGFIIVGDSSGTYFTRAGALRKDDDGNLIIPNGMKVMGWQADAEGKGIVRSNISELKLDSPQNKTAKPQATTEIEISGNLDISDKAAGIPIQIKMYDSLGNLHSLDLKAEADGANWKMVIPDPITLADQNGVKRNVATTPQDIKFGFDTDGKLDTATAGLVGKFDIPGFDFKAAVSPDPVKYPDVTLNAEIAGVEVDFSAFTQYNAKTNVDPKTVTGRAPGKMMGYDIGGDGIITAYYDNGDRKLLGQVVVAEFDNPAGLEKVGDNIYRATANSGDFDGIGKVGIFQAGVLEMSNVDLSKEFTEMITTQRGFQANSKIISTSDEMLHELVNLKR